MDYHAIYNRLIERGRSSRSLNFKETHHIVPRCMGGDDSKENLVDLTPEEHFVAHQLLLKMYPDVIGLAHAAKMMTTSSKRLVRSNKYFGWLKRRFISECRKRVGEKNPSFGTFWITNLSGENRKVKINSEVPEGWFRGRFGTATIIRKKQKRFQPHTVCTLCGEKIQVVTKYRKLCRDCFVKKQTMNSHKQRVNRS